MRVLIDECLPKQIKRFLSAEMVRTVPEMGWASAKNGALLHLVEKDFDVLLTNDQNLEHQQNIKKFDLAFVVLVAETNDISDLEPLMLNANEAMKKIRSGEIMYIEETSD